MLKHYILCPEGYFPAFIFCTRSDWAGTGAKEENRRRGEGIGVGLHRSPKEDRVLLSHQAPGWRDCSCRRKRSGSSRMRKLHCKTNTTRSSVLGKLETVVSFPQVFKKILFKFRLKHSPERLEGPSGCWYFWFVGGFHWVLFRTAPFRIVLPSFSYWFCNFNFFNDIFVVVVIVCVYFTVIEILIDVFVLFLYTRKKAPYWALSSSKIYLE